MMKHTPEGISYAPLYIHRFPLLLSRSVAEEDWLNAVDPDKLISISDKLRYYRRKKSLHQRDVADYTGLSRSTYIHYENGLDYYPPDKLTRIAELLEVDVTDLLDEYNIFLRKGQGQQIKMLRKSLKLTQNEFGKRFGVQAVTVKRWEAENMRISKKKWEVYHQYFNSIVPDTTTSNIRLLHT